jgi:hypothetical protein
MTVGGAGCEAPARRSVVSSIQKGIDLLGLVRFPAPRSLRPDRRGIVSLPIFQTIARPNFLRVSLPDRPILPTLFIETTEKQPRCRILSSPYPPSPTNRFFHAFPSFQPSAGDSPPHQMVGVDLLFVLYE